MSDATTEEAPAGVEPVAPEERPGLVTKYLLADEINWTPGESSDVSYISTDVVDHDREVIVSAGIDYQSVFLKNPVVLAKHDMKSWPVGTCEWIKAAKATKTRQFNGLIAKTLYDTDPDAQRVFGMVKRLVVKGKSVTVAPPDDLKPGEWGPPTKEELKARPDWAGASRIIRRSVLIEYSVVPVPANPESLVLAVSKGLELPSQLAGVLPEPAEKAMPESSGPGGGYASNPDGDGDDEESPGYCPKCMAKAEADGDGLKCVNGHAFARSEALSEPAPPKKAVTLPAPPRVPKCRSRAEAEAARAEAAARAVRRVLDEADDRRWGAI